MRQLLPTPPVNQSKEALVQNSPRCQIREGCVKGCDRVRLGGSRHVNESTRESLHTYQRRAQQCGTLSCSDEKSDPGQHMFRYTPFRECLLSHISDPQGTGKRISKSLDGWMPTSAAHSFFAASLDTKFLAFAGPSFPHNLPACLVSRRAHTREHNLQDQGEVVILS